MKISKKSIYLMETALFLILSLTVYILASRRDFLEVLIEFAHSHEEYELDELIPVALFANLALLLVLIRRIGELRRKNRELNRAAKEIERLQGILPICSSCKKVRTGEGYWKQVESYLQEHSDLLFSHSICPECARKLYGDLSKGEREQ